MPSQFPREILLKLDPEIIFTWLPSPSSGFSYEGAG